MGFKASGELHVIHETKQISARFTKREFVLKLDDGSRYPQFVLFQLTGNRCDALDRFRVERDAELVPAPSATQTQEAVLEVAASK